MQCKFSPCDGDSFDARSFNEKSIPNLKIDTSIISARIYFSFIHIHELLFFFGIIGQGVQWSTPFLVKQALSSSVVNIEII